MNEALIEALKDRPELLNEVESLSEAATSNASKVQNLERDLKIAVDKRQGLKEMIRKTTGLSELSEEALSKLGHGDEALKGEVSQLQERMQQVIEEKEGLAGKHAQEINSMRMHDMLRSMNVQEGVWNEQAFEAVANLMLNGAAYEGGSFVYKNEDGSTVFGSDGKALTVQEKLAQLRSDESVYQFKPTQGGGAGGAKSPENTTQKTHIQKVVSDTMNSMHSY